MMINPTNDLWLDPTKISWLKRKDKYTIEIVIDGVAINLSFGLQPECDAVFKEIKEAIMTPQIKVDPRPINEILKEITVQEL